MNASEKLAATLTASAMHKRTLAEILWQEAEKDMAQARQMLEGMNDGKAVSEQGAGNRPAD